MQMLAERKFPTDNICLKICLDVHVARWYGVQNTSQMRYQAETKRPLDNRLQIILWKVYVIWVATKMLAKYRDQVREGSVCHPNLISTSLYPGGGGGTLPEYGVGVCSCGSETPTLNKGKLLVKSRPLFRDTNHYLVVFPYTLHCTLLKKKLICIFIV